MIKTTLFAKLIVTSFIDFSKYCANDAFLLRNILPYSIIVHNFLLLAAWQDD